MFSDKKTQSPRLSIGIVQVYTGNGKGKTTAALGLALRAVGHGLKVIMIQFLKGRKYTGEKIISKNIKNFEIKQFGREEFVDPDNPTEEDIALARTALAFAEKIIMEGRHDLVILDEINVAIKFGLISLDAVLNIIKNKPRNVEIVLTGRHAHRKIVECADLVTEMLDIKHPFDKGLLARKGIDY